MLRHCMGITDGDFLALMAMNTQTGLYPAAPIGHCHIQLGTQTV